MALKFYRMPAPFKGMEIFGATKGGWTFIISEDKEHEAGVIRASVKPLGATPFDGKRGDLGEFNAFSTAERACNDFYSNRNN